MPHEDYCYALERENRFLYHQLATLKTELKAIGEAIDDPRTDLTMTMGEVIVEQKQQLAAALADVEKWKCAFKNGGTETMQRQLAEALAACSMKDEALASCDRGDYSTGHVIYPSFNESLVEKALAVQPDDSALKAWLEMSNTADCRPQSSLQGVVK